jgi:hypothetical protein
MKSIHRWLVLVLGIGALALAILVGSSPPAGAASGPTPVYVTNPSLPVVATQSGTWTVDVAPHPTSVLRVTVSATDGYFTWQNDTGRRAVIELISAETSDLLRLWIGGGGPTGVEVAFGGTPVTGTNEVVVSAQTKIVVEPGETIDGPAPETSIPSYMTLMGHLE